MDAYLAKRSDNPRLSRGSTWDRSAKVTADRPARRVVLAALREIVPGSSARQNREALPSCCRTFRKTKNHSRLSGSGSALATAAARRAVRAELSCVDGGISVMPPVRIESRLKQRADQTYPSHSIGPPAAECHPNTSTVSGFRTLATRIARCSTAGTGQQ